MDIKTYLESGILETYVIGNASEAEAEELLRLKSAYPEVNQALLELELDMENFASRMAIAPPPQVWDKIEQQLEGLILRPELEPEPFRPRPEPHSYKTERPGDQYIEVEAESRYMKIHKAWRWVFAAVFVLGKIFLGFAIYFYLENRQAQEQIQELKTQVHQPAIGR